MSGTDGRHLDSVPARRVFGDRYGLVLFLGVLSFVGLYWRAGPLVTDTETLVRTLQAVSEGRLWIEPASGTFLTAPGTVISDGLVYGRNYGQVLLALPFLWLIEGVSVVADTRLGLAALWHLILLAGIVQVGALFDARRSAALAGSAFVVGLFLVNTTLVTRFVGVAPELLALQLSNMVVTALLAVFMYQIVRRYHDVPVAIASGAASALVLPIGFWAGLPKRHVIVAAILLGIVYAVARSRSTDGHRRVPGFGTVPVYRAAAYALVGLLAWIHAAEALFVFLALLAVDVPTAPSNELRSLGFIATAFFVSLLPFFVTNVLVAGDVFKPPRTLTPADTTSPRTADTLRESTPGGTILGKVMWIWILVWSQVTDSLATLLDPGAVYRTWIRSGSLADFGLRGVPSFRGVNLTVLESVPLLAALVVAVPTVLRHGARSIRERLHPTDWLSLAFVVAFVLLYMQRLPIHIQVTVRYLLPVYPLLLFLLVRQLPIRALFEQFRGYVLWSYASVVLLGTQLILAYVLTVGLTVSEAAQLHAQLALAAAGLLAVAVLASSVSDRLRPGAAAALGTAAGLGTSFVLLTGMAYYSFIGPYALPISQAIADLIGRI